ncbi:unnamed protein product [Mytilus coruscus]|uniref:Uncharacterized protein n=1 Tax=Mytilus coruscus TaxID=42192 RepID=A0A6J8DDG9_MYTCO|nr:unnamed protein product [Mytilus coruscus]
MADRQISMISFINRGKRKADDDGDKENSRPNRSTKTDSCIEIVEIEKKSMKTTEKQDFKSYYCSVYQKYITKARNRTETWIDRPCIRRRRESCKGHLLSEMHKTNLSNERLTVIAEEQGQGLIQTAFEIQINANEAAIIAQLKIMYLLKKFRIPQNLPVLVYQPYICAVIRHIENRFPNCEVLTAFKIFDPTVAPAVSSQAFTSYGC